MCWSAQDMPFYTGESTPFFERSKLATDKSYVPYLDLSRNFRPQRMVQDNCVVADTVTKVVGKCIKVGRNRRKKGIYVTISGTYPKTGRNRNSRIQDCVAVPEVGEFVRQQSTKKWFQIMAHGNEFAEMRAVLVGSPTSAQHQPEQHFDGTTGAI